MVIKKQNLVEGGFVSIVNEIAQDMTLSVHARSMLMYMLSKPPDFQFTVSGLAKQNGFTDKRTKATIKELVERGYMQSVRLKDGKGRFIKFDYIVTQDKGNFNEYLYELKNCQEPTPF
jgi:DNA-binding MarR family transcriptional regulator